MNTLTLGIDLGKNVFSPHGGNQVGKAVTRKNSGLVFHCEAMQVAGLQDLLTFVLELMHAPAYREHPLRFIVNTYSANT